MPPPRRNLFCGAGGLPPRPRGKGGGAIHGPRLEDQWQHIGTEKRSRPVSATPRDASEVVALDRQPGSHGRCRSGRRGGRPSLRDGRRARHPAATVRSRASATGTPMAGPSRRPCALASMPWPYRRRGPTCGSALRANGHLQATGRDARGRKQYRYHDTWRAVRDADKFSRLSDFGASLARLRDRLDTDLSGAAGPAIRSWPPWCACSTTR